MGWFNSLIKRDTEKYIEDKINKSEGTLVAETEKTRLLVDKLEVGEYMFLSFVIIADLEVSTYDGCRANFVFNNNSVQLESDTMEIKSDYSNAYKLGRTQIDFDLTSDFLTQLLEFELTEITFEFSRRQSISIPITNLEQFKDILSNANEHESEEIGSN